MEKLYTELLVEKLQSPVCEENRCKAHVEHCGHRGLADIEDCCELARLTEFTLAVTVCCLCYMHLVSLLSVGIVVVISSDLL